jgi:hypothetical protein
MPPRTRNLPKEAGTAWERRVVDFAAGMGLPWDRAPLRGTADLLDVQGCVPMGWLIGAKAKHKGSGDRLSEAMNEAAAARKRLRPPNAGVIPVQVVQRPGYPVGRGFAVMEYSDFLRLVIERNQHRVIPWEGEL